MKGKDLKKILKDNRFNQADVAREMEITPQHLSNILNSEDVSLKWLERIQEATGLKFIEKYDPGLRFRMVEESPIDCPGCQEKQKEIEILRRELEKNTDYINLLKEQLMSCQEDLRNCRKDSGKSKAASA